MIKLFIYYYYLSNIEFIPFHIQCVSISMTTASISEVAEILVADFLFVQNHSQLFLGLGIAPKDSQQCYNLYKLQNSSLIEITVTLLRIWISQCPEPASVGQLKSVCHQEGFIHIEGICLHFSLQTIIIV